MTELYYTDADRRKSAAQRAAATRKANRERDLQRREEARIKREAYLAQEEIERPIREKEQAENKAKWIKHWRNRIIDAVETRDANLAAHRLDSLIFELAEWGGSCGFSTPFKQ